MADFDRLAPVCAPGKLHCQEGTAGAPAPPQNPSRATPRSGA
jgi:hypothetical protein